jgi:hypothetical protein
MCQIFGFISSWMSHCRNTVESADKRQVRLDTMELLLELDYLTQKQRNMDEVVLATLFANDTNYLNDVSYRVSISS